MCRRRSCCTKRRRTFWRASQKPDTINKLSSSENKGKTRDNAIYAADGDIIRARVPAGGDGTLTSFLPGSFNIGIISGCCV